VLSRVYALSELIYGGAVAVGVVLAPVLIATLGARASLSMIGVAFALVTMLGCGIPAPDRQRMLVTIARRSSSGA
jgi:hypothetical protein